MAAMAVTTSGATGTRRRFSQGYEGGTVNGGNDTIRGGNGNDEIRGDGDAGRGGAFSEPGRVDGGNDTIYGGAGDDVILGDGDAEGDIFGSQGAVIGGNDTIYGGAGNDTIHGDGRSLRDGDSDDDSGIVIGGNDVIFGGSGNDTLYGDGGHDILCGEDGHAPVNPLDTLYGGVGTDIACAIDDKIMVVTGVKSTLDLAANDDALDDESDEAQPLTYQIVSVDEYITIHLFDELTGLLTFSATRSGTIQYAVCRDIVSEPPALLELPAEAPIEPTEAEQLCSFATAYVTVNPIEKTAADVEDTEVDDVEVVSGQILPNTGASSDPRVLVPAGLALIVAGALMLGAGRRRSA